jgi:hypothetical protein
LARAGFANFARLSSNADVPGKMWEPAAALPKQLHVDVREHVFRVSWRSGATVLLSNDVPLQPMAETKSGRRYPELAKFLDQDWHANGSHRDRTDPAADEAVLRSTTRVPGLQARLGFCGQLRCRLSAERRKNDAKNRNQRASFASHAPPQGSHLSWSVVGTRHEWPFEMGDD